MREIVELRVHGVGGPQGPKMLGWTSDTDVVTLAPIEVPGPDGKPEPSPRDSGTRFVRPIRPEPGRPVTEAYEWGALTMGSLLKGLWVVFLPFTLLNVGGWARTKPGRPSGAPWYRDLGARTLAYLGTATYVLWLAYLFLELAGMQWRERILLADERHGEDPIAVVLARCLLRPAAFVLLLVVLAVLVIVNRRSGADFEEVMPDRDTPSPSPAPVPPKSLLEKAAPFLALAHAGAAAATGACLAALWATKVRPDQMRTWLPVSLAALAALTLWRYYAPRPPERDGAPPRKWKDTETVIDPDFFAHHRSLDRLRHRHTVFAAGVVGFALGVAWLGRDQDHTRLGLAIVSVATIQVTVLVAVWVFGFYQGSERLVRAGLLTLGTVLCHAVFAGVGLFLRERLASLPATDQADTPLEVGIELSLNDQFAIALAIAVLVLVAAALIPPRQSENATGTVATVARRVPVTGVLVALSFVVIFASFSISELTGTDWSKAMDAEGVALVDVPWDWYERVRTLDSANALQALGSKVLLFLPLGFVLAMRSSTSVGKVVGNIWDVLTFWPRRYHPFAVPPYAERAVPELRARVKALLDQGDGVILSGHSQGSVLSVAAIGPLLDTNEERRLHLIVYGSPLGTMFARVFRAAFGDSVLSEVRQRLRDKGGRWWVLWRKTDPIGGPVFREDPHRDQLELVDPPPGKGWVNPPGLGMRAPLDRPPPWGVKRVHSSYHSEKEYRDAVSEAARLLRAPVPPAADG